MAAQTIWNQPHITIKSSETIDTFRTKLKTCLFEIAFPSAHESRLVVELDRLYSFHGEVNNEFDFHAMHRTSVRVVYVVNSPGWGG